MYECMCDKTNITVCYPKTIKKTPASAENRKRVEFMDSHNFSFSVDKETGVLCSKVEKK